jgi:hypothetical protein
MRAAPRATLQLDREDALDCTPVKHGDAREERSADGALLLCYPVTVRPWFAGLARRLGAPPAPRTARLQLDAMGTEVWRMVDGRTSLREIAARFAERHRVGRREAQTAVAQFVRELGRRGLVGLQPGRPDGDH